MTNCLNSIKTYVPWIIDVNYYHYQYILLALCIHYYIILTPSILHIYPLTNTFTNSKKSQRIAAFEIATMASTNDDNKFIIVAEGGLVENVECDKASENIIMYNNNENIIIM